MILKCDVLESIKMTACRTCLSMSVDLSVDLSIQSPYPVGKA